MSQQNINVGSAPNDGTGDPIRTAMIKVQNNFSEFYAAFTPNLTTNNVTAANNLTVTANVSANIVTAPIMYITANAYVNIISTTPSSSANLYLDPDGFADVVITNQTELWVLSNAQSTSVSTGAVVVNGGIGVANSIVVGNSVLVTGTVNAASHTVGSNFVANTTGVTISSNTFNLGSATTSANGYTYLPNGLKMNWGWVSANSTSAGAVTFSSAYTTNAYVVTATSNTATSTYQAAVVSWTKTGANVVTANATSTNVFWTAIGY
jgi:hypothetical protein